MAEIHSQRVKEKDLDTIMGEDINFKGSLVCEDPIMIKGNFTGDIKSTGEIFIEKSAYIEANISGVKIQVRGEVIGDIEATNSVQLFSSGKVTGDIKAPKVKMENGCFFSGLCHMTGVEK